MGHVLRAFVVSFLLLPVVGVNSRAAQKSSTAAAPEVPVFRTGTRIVLVDVVATDSDGKPIHDLKAADFQVLDDGKPQRVRSFDEHISSKVEPGPVERGPHLAPGIYSNWTPKSTNSAVNVILFDTLNTEFTDQAYARKKMVEYLKALPPGQQVALFTLGDHLRMVQNFTGTTDTLIAVANGLGALNSFRDAGTDNQSALTDSTSALELPTDTRGSGALAQAEALQSSMPAGTESTLHFASSALGNFLNENVNTLRDIRMRITLDALRDIARSLGAAPGRKNLIWVSGDFPTLIGSYTERSGFRVYDREVRTTAALLAANQIAVYPIDARGLLTTGGAQATYDAMDEMAKQTGGHAFYGSNDILNAIGKSIDSGANYYTLAYTPSNKNWNGELRQIEVKVGRKNVKLMYRRGYYAVADPFAPVLNIKTTNVDVQRRLIEAVQPNSPQAAGILLKAKTSTPQADKPVEIDYEINAGDLTLTQSENGDRAVRYQFVAVAWDENNNNAGQAWEMVDKEITSQDAAALLRSGISSRRFLTLKPGSYQLALGIIDIESKKMGTLVIPLKIPKQTAALQGSNHSQN